MLNIGKLIRSDFTKGSDYLEDLVIALDGLDATIQEILSSPKSLPQSLNMRTKRCHQPCPPIAVLKDLPLTFGDSKACVIPGNSVYDEKLGPKTC